MFRVRPHLWHILAVPLLLLIIAGGASAGGVWLWANHHFRAGLEALEHNRLAEARGHLRLYLKVWPSDGEAHFQAGRAARRAQDFKEAEKHFKECHRLQGGSLALSMEEALIRVQQGEVDRAEAYFARQVEQGHPEAPLILEALVEGYMQVHRISEAMACIDLWEKLQPDNMYLYLLRGSIRERIENLEAAANDYRKVLELNPDYEEGRLRLARMLIEIHQCDQALPHLEHLRRLQPSNPTVLVNLARCCMELDRPQDARQALSEALDHDPTDQPALVVSAQLALQAGESEQAEKLVRRALAVDPYEREANFLLSQCLRQCGKIAEADQQAAKFKRIDADWRAVHEIVTVKMPKAPHDPEFRYQLGVILLRLGEDKTGVLWLKRALETDPKHEASRKALAEYYERLGDSRQAANYRVGKPEIPNSKLATNPKS
jgi:tetratricopeptide (TPR) repeat protein